MYLLMDEVPARADCSGLGGESEPAVFGTLSFKFSIQNSQNLSEFFHLPAALRKMVIIFH